MLMHRCVSNTLGGGGNKGSGCARDERRYFLLFLGVWYSRNSKNSKNSRNSRNSRNEKGHICPSGCCYHVCCDLRGEAVLLGARLVLVDRRNQQSPRAIIVAYHRAFLPVTCLGT
jgi:hypothetical protein